MYIQIQHITSNIDTSYNWFKSRFGEFQDLMQLQQTGFKISTCLLTPLPKTFFFFATLITLLLVLINTILGISSKPTFQLHDCLHQYYTLTHENITTFIQRESMNVSQQTPHTISQYLKYLNQSRILLFQTGPLPQPLRPYTIQLNYTIPSSIAQSQNTQGTTQLQIQNGFYDLAYVVSNYALFSFNKSDVALLKKHGIIIDRIVISDYVKGYRYLGADVDVQRVQDFVYVLLQSLEVRETMFKVQIMVKINQLSIQRDQQKANPTPEEKQKTEGKQQQKKPVNDTKQQQKQKEQQKPEQQKTEQGNKKQGQKTPEIVLLSTPNTNKTPQLLQQGSQTSQQSPNNQQNVTKSTKLQRLNQQILFLGNILASLTEHTTYGKHKIFYTFDNKYKSIKQWQNIILSSTSTDVKLRFIWHVLAKIFYIMMIIAYVYFLSVLVAMTVRYGFLIGLLALTLLCPSLRSSAGWMNRYTALLRDNGQRGGTRIDKKIVFQIIFSFFGVYTLYTVMGYWLSETITSVIMVAQILPFNPYYSSQFLASLFIIQIFYYIFLRTRTSLSFFPKISGIFTFTCLLFISYHPFFITSFILNFHMLINMMTIIFFLGLEKIIREEQMESGYRPCLEKPRMLFYLGYDLDWHQGLPPLWTMFQPWFDIGYASQNQRAYIDQNYELLYGKLMGVNEPQELPEEDENEDEVNFRQIEMVEQGSR